MKKALLIGCLLVLPLVACGGEPPPVAHVEIEPAEIALPYPGYAEYRLAWTLEAPLEGRQGSLAAFIHLLDDEGAILRTFDHPIPFEWQSGATPSYTQKIFQSALAPALETGRYRLTIGLYDEANRWGVSTSGGAVRSSESLLATVTVDEVEGGFPAFYFSPEWLPVEGGVDRQVLGRRWLREDGVIRLGELTRPGSLWLLVGVPTAAEEDLELIFDEGADSPQVTVTSGCGDVAVTVSGSGSHGVTVPVTAGEDGVVAAECEIVIDSNYYLTSTKDGTRRTVALESLSWLAQ